MQLISTYLGVLAIIWLGSIAANAVSGVAEVFVMALCVCGILAWIVWVEKKS